MVILSFLRNIFTVSETMIETRIRLALSNLVSYLATTNDLLYIITIHNPNTGVYLQFTQTLSRAEGRLMEISVTKVLQLNKRHIKFNIIKTNVSTQLRSVFVNPSIWIKRPSCKFFVNQETRDGDIYEHCKKNIRTLIKELIGPVPTPLIVKIQMDVCSPELSNLISSVVQSMH